MASRTAALKLCGTVPDCGLTTHRLVKIYLHSAVAENLSLFHLLAAHFNCHTKGISAHTKGKRTLHQHGPPPALQQPRPLRLRHPRKVPPAIHEYPRVISTAQKLIRACTTLSIPIFATTQSAAKLGPTCSELTATPLYTVDKTAFSMMVPELRGALTSTSPYGEPLQVALVGIETHICVTQTALDLLAEGHRVFVIADGVSSCNEGERGLALKRLRAEGAVVTTSESWLYECMGDAGIPEYGLLVLFVV